MSKKKKTYKHFCSTGLDIKNTSNLQEVFLDGTSKMAWEMKWGQKYFSGHALRQGNQALVSLKVLTRTREPFSSILIENDLSQNIGTQVDQFILVKR